MTPKSKCPACGGNIAPRLGAKGPDGRYNRYWQCLACSAITTHPYEPDCRVIPFPAFAPSAN